ncbi:MAG: UvrD-helicase domain-containing protein [Bacteroidales bacterium]|jgi:DNA helicase-2/ATP-dependent DNA helicase PcrA|nr:UvrD-helicase domain-containing protein [Bacteroidales bacterium]
MGNILDDLNQAQREATACTDGAMMVIAGAGSGKTRVLTYRVAYMIEQGINPFDILCLTFTNKAAAEMKERIISLLGSSAGRYVWMGTFHSIFSKVLHIEAEWLGYSRNFTIYDTNDSKSLISNIIKGKNLDPKVYKPSVILSKISQAKANLITAEEYCNNHYIQETDFFKRIPETGNIYLTYTQRLKQADAMDFDDLLFNMYLMLRDFPELLDKYQKKFKYILVDEYQDTNYAQYQIIKKLAARNENICVVGDDAQSIYAFRGANIQNILNFKNDYPDFQIFKLEQNYRSTKNIIEAANSVIQYNKKQIPKQIWTQNAAGEKIKLIFAIDDTTEAALTVKSIQQKKEAKNLQYKDFTILYRTNAQSRPFEEVLRRMNIPYRIYGGMSFYNRKEIKDVLAYFRLTVNLYDEEALRRIINYPQRGIGATTMEKFIAIAGERGVPIWTILENPTQFQVKLSKNTLIAIENFVTKIKSFRADLHTKNAFELAEYIAEQSGIKKDLREQTEEKERFDNLGELLNAAKSFVDRPAEFEIDMETGEEQEIVFPSLDRFLNEVALYTDADKDEDGDDNKVKLMTIHAAKGLEFLHTYIVGLEEGLMPLYLIENEDDLEEERRLLYVAITRARESLTLSLAQNRRTFGSYNSHQPSPFLQEIDPDLLQVERQKPSQSVEKQPLTTFKKIEKKPTLPLTPQPPVKPRPFVAHPVGYKKPVIVPPNLSEIVLSPEQLSEQMQVFHATFGTGIVEEIDVASQKVIITFDNVGKKTMLLKFAKLRVVLN